MAMDEESPLVDQSQIGDQTLNHSRDIHILSWAFLLSFLAYGAAQNLQSTLNTAGTGIAELIALEISKQTQAPLEDTRKRVWLVDSKGLIVRSRLDSLQHFKKPWAHEHEPVRELLDAIKTIRPTVLIGSSGAGQTFTAGGGDAGGKSTKK